MQNKKALVNCMAITVLFFGFGVAVKDASAAGPSQYPICNERCAPTDFDSNCIASCESTQGTPTTVPGLPWLNNQDTGLPIQDATLNNQATGSSTMGGVGTVVCDQGFEPVAGVCFPITDLPDPQGGIFQIIFNFMMWLMTIFGMLSVIAFVISGIQYVTSAGDEGQIETAKRNMKWSIVGVLVGLSGLIIITAVSRALTASPFI